MRLNESDYYQYLRLNHALLLYAGQGKKLISKTMTVDEFLELKDVQLKFKCREAFRNDIGIIKKFVKENPSQLSEEDLGIVEGFRHMVSGRFFIAKYLKEHAIFIQDEYVYGVLALNDPIEHVTRYAPLPTMVDAVLLPFKGKIVYDGIIQPYNVRFGSGYRSSLNDVYRKAKAKYGVITSLPFHGKEAWAGKSPDEQLGYFMGTKANREEFEDKIETLLRKHPELLPLYHRTWGKIHSAQYKRKFKSLGLAKAWYAILEGNLIGGALKKPDLEKNLKGLLPKEKQDWIFVFRM